MERILISEWEQQATAALANMKNDDNGNIAPTVSECRSDANYYPAPAHQPAADDKQWRPDDTNPSTAACPIANTLRSTTSSSDDADEEDSDEEVGAMIYASSKTARARRAVTEAASVQINDSNQPPSYEPRSKVRKRKSLSKSSSKEMASAPPKKKKRATKKSFEQRIDELRVYKEKHGHVNVKKSEDESLYSFCINMRFARNNPEKPSSLTDDRVASLDALGFDWTVKKQVDRSFEQRIADLKAYKEKNGHINVKKSDDKSLYGFCQKIRQKSTVALTDERIASLDALGFGWRWFSEGNKRIYY